MKKRALIFEIVSYISMVCSIITSTICFSSSQYVVRNAESTILNEWLDDNGSGYAYLNTTFEKNNENKLADSYFLGKYSSNFHISQTSVIAVSDDNGIRKFEIDFDGESLPFNTAVVSGKAYTNKSEPPTFETVLINLYKYRTKEEEIRFDHNKFNGFIYIPDYYADYIIDNNQNINSYDELLEKANDHFLRISFNGRFFKYKIANIFHVNGFAEKYSSIDKFNYDDFEKGKALNMFFNGYVFASNYDHMNEIDVRCRTSLLTMTQSKRYVIEDYLSDVSTFCEERNSPLFDLDITLVDKDSNIKHFNRNSEIKSAWFNSQTDSWNYLYIVLIIFVAAFIVSLILSISFQPNGKQLKLFSLLSFSTCVPTLLVAFVIKKFVRTITVFKIFNGLSLALVASFALLHLIILIDDLSKVKKANGDLNEEKSNEKVD